MSEIITYLSGGRLFLSVDGHRFEEVENQFSIQAGIRELEIQKKKEWKTTGTGAQFMGVAAAAAADVPVMKSIIGGAVFSPERDALVYSMENYSSVGGLFSYNVKTREENRLFHRESFRVKNLDRNPVTGRIICSMDQTSGGANIGMINEKLTGTEQITEGDSADEMPRWVPGSTDTIVYQSAGIGRNSAGFPVGTGNYCINRLCLSTGEIETLLDDLKYDYLLPCMNAQGDLYCIRRKYSDGSRRSLNPVYFLRDIVLLPFGLIRTLLNYLNLQSLIYSRKPLITAVTNKEKEIDHKALFLHGRMVDIQKMNKKADDSASLVPGDWELVCLGSDAKLNVLAKGVVSFDLKSDGTPVYSNGRKIYSIVHNKSEQIAEGKMIECIRLFSV